MKHIARILLLSTLMATSAAHACSSVDWREATPQDLTVVQPTFSVEENAGNRAVITLGSLNNSSTSCLEDVVMEARYFDAKGVLIDTITRQLYGVVVPPQEEVAFRLGEASAKPKSSYATQTVRVISVAAREPRRAAQKPSLWAELLVSWGPIFLLLTVFIYFFAAKKSPQQRIVQIVEEQSRLMQEKNRILERIANNLKRD